MPTEIKKQDWSDIDKLMESFGEILLKKPEENKNLKQQLRGIDSMTDKQHCMIIALFTNELNWSAYSAFKFIVRLCPQVKQRLQSKSLLETDIRELYKVITKSDAIKIINVLKSIARRGRK